MTLTSGGTASFERRGEQHHGLSLCTNCLPPPRFGRLEFSRCRRSTVWPGCSISKKCWMQDVPLSRWMSEAAICRQANGRKPTCRNWSYCRSWVGLEDVHSHRQPAPSHHNQIGCPRTGDTWDASGGSPRHLRVLRRETRSEMKLISQNLRPQFWHASGNPPTRPASFIRAIRNVS